MQRRVLVEFGRGADRGRRASRRSAAIVLIVKGLRVSQGLEGSRRASDTAPETYRRPQRVYRHRLHKCSPANRGRHCRDRDGAGAVGWRNDEITDEQPAFGPSPQLPSPPHASQP